jgi:hypothetical protein
MDARLSRAARTARPTTGSVQRCRARSSLSTRERARQRLQREADASDQLPAADDAAAA